MNQRVSLESFNTDDAAAFWFARVHSKQMSEQEYAEFESWKQAPANDHAYRTLQGIWNATTLVPSSRLLALTEEEIHQPRQTGRRRTLFALGAAVCATGVAAVVLPKWLAGFPEFDERYATELGQRREVTLPDASVIAMNTATQLTVRMYPDKRVVNLTAGEATFTVTKNTDKPFYVQAGSATVRVTGTVFNVRQDPGRIRVTVVSGSVDVSHTDGDMTAHVALGANDVVAVTDTGGLGPVEKTDPAPALAWRGGRVVFFDTPLSAAVAEINRYTREPIRLDDAAVKRMRIAGVFNIDNPASFLKLLPEIAPVAVKSHPDGGVQIVAR
jgi:transmembrane sensor